MNQAKNMFYAYNVSTILADLGVEVDTYKIHVQSVSLELL